MNLRLRSRYLQALTKRAAWGTSIPSQSITLTFRTGLRHNFVASSKERREKREGVRGGVNWGSGVCAAKETWFLSTKAKCDNATMPDL